MFPCSYIFIFYAGQTVSYAGKTVTSMQRPSEDGEGPQANEVEYETPPSPFAIIFVFFVSRGNL